MARDPFSRAFFHLHTPTLARALLGAVLARRLPSGELLRGCIVETEAYDGPEDTACHASKGRTSRTEVMFGEGGHAYVYLIYGMYDMLNITAGVEGFPAAVLIRALEPLEGIDAMLSLRGGNRAQLTNGPGRLCRALDIDRSLNGVDLLTDERLWIEPGIEVPDEAVGISPRIGIDYAAPDHRDALWRYYVKGNPYVSATRPAGRAKKGRAGGAK